MSEFGALWYKRILKACAILVAILLSILEIIDLVICILIVFGIEFKKPKFIQAVSQQNAARQVVCVLKLIWIFIFLWSLFKCCIGIRKKNPNYMAPYLLAQLVLMVVVTVRLISWYCSWKLDKLKDQILLEAFSVNLYWITLMKSLYNFADHEQIYLSNLIQIGINCCCFVVIYFYFEVLRYEAICRQHEEILGNIQAIDEIQMRAKPNDYVVV